MYHDSLGDSQNKRSSSSSSPSPSPPHGRMANRALSGDAEAMHLLPYICLIQSECAGLGMGGFIIWTVQSCTGSIVPLLNITHR